MEVPCPGHPVQKEATAATDEMEDAGGVRGDGQLDAKRAAAASRVRAPRTGEVHSGSAR
ncbi:hypothetical protein K523DRAFT_324890 [Schizophyllum commune Tattone D]|nr:hypothetical protein K523DRAFT_324890 [Schizophyllum commune Tattone D]